MQNKQPPTAPPPEYEIVRDVNVRRALAVAGFFPDQKFADRGLPLQWWPTADIHVIMTYRLNRQVARIAQYLGPLHATQTRLLHYNGCEYALRDAIEVAIALGASNAELAAMLDGEQP